LPVAGWPIQPGHPPRQVFGMGNAAEQHTVSRLTVEVGPTAEAFASRFEEAVPPVPMEKVAALVSRHAPWQEMLDLIEASAPHGLLIYHRLEAMPLMRLAGDDAFCVTY